MKFFVAIFVTIFWAASVGNVILEELEDTTISSEIRIIGGSVARAGQFPFAAAINVSTAVSSVFCGGALISTRFIITSAHCIQNATELIIKVGSNSLYAADFNRVTLATSTYYLHPEFDSTTLENDIALIELHQDIQYSDYIGKIYLPVTEYHHSVNVTVIGWGQISDSKPGIVEDLNWVDLVTITNDHCRIYFGQQIFNTMVCAVGSYNEGICTGDSGDPLIYLLNNRHPVIVGIASFHSGLGCEGEEPSGFTRIHPYTKWILNITGNL